MRHLWDLLHERGHIFDLFLFNYEIYIHLQVILPKYLSTSLSFEASSTTIHSHTVPQLQFMPAISVLQGHNEAYSFVLTTTELWKMSSHFNL